MGMAGVAVPVSAGVAVAAAEGMERVGLLGRVAASATRPVGLALEAVPERGTVGGTTAGSAPVTGGSGALRRATDAACDDVDDDAAVVEAPLAFVQASRVVWLPVPRPLRCGSVGSACV
jgi:hypothetical protein